jgi:ATP-dependent exoDNAse (exonuclease V) beta subunit
VSSSLNNNSGNQQKPADWQQRARGRDLGHSYIVQAPAGSGKTELLTQRMLALLSKVENPEEVVAITFTRKAAAEMNHRLIGRLQAAALSLTGTTKEDPLQPHEQVSRDLALAVLRNDKKHNWSLLEQPSRLRIRTIDGLSSELARQLPVLSGLGSGHQIATDPDALYRMAATRTMAVIEDFGDPLRNDVTRVLDRYDNGYDKLVTLLTGMLANREQWLGHLIGAREGGGFNREGLERALRKLVQAQLEDARAAIPDELLSVMPAFHRFAIAHDAEKKQELLALLSACGGEDCDFLDLPLEPESLPHWCTFIDSLFTGGGDMRKTVTKREGFPAKGSGKDAIEKAELGQWKDDLSEVFETYRDNLRLREAASIIRTLPMPHYQDEAWESLESLMRIMLRASIQWELVMAESGEVDFGEIASRAIESLGHEDAPSDLALRMDYRIQHLLVDEFQDTSASQIRLLTRLTSGWTDGDGRTLFLVGDPMQSIYRFRKAEVSLFIKAWDGGLFDQIQLVPLQLTVNFRSTQPVVEWVNTTFPKVMPQVSDPVMGAVSYSLASTKPGVGNNGTVEVHLQAERDDEAEADDMVEIIGQCDVEETIAILVRSRSHAQALLAKLDQKKRHDDRYRYQAIQFTPLAETTVIKDLVALTLALIQPADRLNWLATLRAPYIGLDLNDLDTLVAGNNESIMLGSLYEASIGEGNAHLLSDNGRMRLNRIVPVLQQAVDQRGRLSTRTLVELTWIKLGGPACVDNNSELDDAATYFDLLDSLENENLPVANDTLDLRMKNLYAEPDAQASDKLQVLTIYSSKGLQFDNVLLPGLNRSPRGDDPKLFHWFEMADENTIVMSPMRNSKEKELQKKSGDLIGFITAVEKQRQALENGRLLYVAATRAIHSLHLFVSIAPNKKDEVKAKHGSLMVNLWPAIEEQQHPALMEKVVAITESAEDEPSDESESGETSSRQPLNLKMVYRRLQSDWQLPEAPVSAHQSDTDEVDTHDYIEFSWAGEDARLIGNLVHRLLQLIGEQGVEQWKSSGGINKRKSWCRAQLASEGVQQDKANAIVERAASAINTCLASEQGLWILDTHQDAGCELALTAVLDKRPTNIVLDRTFVENGVRWIIDYKTSSHSGGNLEGFLDNEASRYEEQMQRYRQALALTETLPIKTALYFPLLDRLKQVGD